jgi:transcriptional regulator with XRE-family HTH domain
MDLTLGARLRAHREHQDVALATIAEETKISLALLEGLERDDISRWPGGLFRRAYVRAYAQKIGLDPEQALREFAEAHPDPVAGSSAVEAVAENLGGKRPKTRIGLMIAGLAGLRPQRADASRPLVTPHVIVPEDAAAVTEIVRLSEPPAAQAEPEPIEAIESEPLAPRLVMIASPETTADVRRDIRTLERSVASTARLCTRIASASNESDLGGALEDTVEIFAAQGAILWALDPDRDALFPVLAHGYPDELLSRLPEVRTCADNAIAAALRCGQKQIVRGIEGATGAFVVPLLTPDGCVGVLALEFADGAEQHELVQALAAIVAAQLSTLFNATPQAIEEEWARPDQSLVAS